MSLSQFLAAFVSNFVAIGLDVAWLLLGLLVAGLLRVWTPSGVLERFLGGRGWWPLIKAALIGTPLPLCSCSVLPTAVQLHRSGISAGATASFLVATPENGIDSLAVSYALLGPWMTVIRPVAAVISAVLTGRLTQFVVDRSGRADAEQASEPAGEAACDCRAGDCQPENHAASIHAQDRQPPWRQVATTVVDLLDDMALWLVFGMLAAAAVQTIVPPAALSRFGSGLLPMLAIVAISIPMYICATASTPIAASMLVAGMSPGTVLVFLLAGPATNLSSAAILRRELGSTATAAYLIGVAATSVGLGWVVDVLGPPIRAAIVPQVGAGGEMIPRSLAITAAIILALLVSWPHRPRAARR